MREDRSRGFFVVRGPGIFGLVCDMVIVSCGGRRVTYEEVGREDGSI